MQHNEIKYLNAGIFSCRHSNVKFRRAKKWTNKGSKNGMTSHIKLNN